MVNTIGNVSYNTKERDKLYAEYLTAKKESDAISKEILAIEDDAEYERRLSEIDKANKKVLAAYKKCFAAQFHKCKNEWFSKVVNGLREKEYMVISKKQYECFIKFASDTDENGWRSGESYCRVGDYLVTLVWHNALRAIKKEQI